MAGRKIVYCEVSFWNKFIVAYQSAINQITSTNSDDFECLKSIFYLLVSQSEVYIDDEKAFLNLADKDKITAFWYKQWTSGQLHFLNDSLPIKEDTPIAQSALFLMDDNNDLVKTANAYGKMVVTPSTWLMMKRFLKEEGAVVHVGDSSFRWEQLRPILQHNCSALIITDSYILNHDLKTNIVPLLDILLPKRLSVSFHLTIMTQETDMPLEDQFNLLRQYILEIRPRLGVKFSLFKCDKCEIHDRSIVSNYIWAKSGAGFDIIVSKGNATKVKHTTTIEIGFPYLQCFSKVMNSSYETIISDAIHFCNPTKHSSLGDVDVANRLLAK